MNKLRLFALVAFSVVFVVSFSACVSKGSYEELLGKLQSAQADITSLQATVSSTQNELAAANSALEQTREKLDDTEKSLMAAQKELTDLKTELKLYKDTLGISVQSGLQPPYTKTLSSNDLIDLSNNQGATNPTWQQLVAFILADRTDSKMYIYNSFMCGAFAEEVQNNAEAAGIRAAVVIIHFRNSTIAHALNVFKTTDEGLVYVDCTGKGLQTIKSDGTLDETVGWDKIAYIAKDKEYGVLSLRINSSTEYDFYEKEKLAWDSFGQKLDAYNQDVERYNKEISGKIFYIGTPEWQRIEEWRVNLVQEENELNNLRAQLIPIWEPLGIVTGVEIYW